MLLFSAPIATFPGDTVGATRVNFFFLIWLTLLNVQTSRITKNTSPIILIHYAPGGLVHQTTIALLAMTAETTNNRTLQIHKK